MKLGLLLSTNLKMAPYVDIFCKILDEQKIDYDLISWDRESLSEERGIVFNYPAPNTRSKIGKMLDYYKFSRFAKSVIKRNKYDKLIVFGAAIAVFMYEFLEKYYPNRFWFDYRDLTIEQNFMRRFRKVCDISSYISISSPGFKKVFPAKYDFILSHNFDIHEVRAALKNNKAVNFNTKSIIISTIGSISHYDANVQVINSLKNNEDFQLKFIGKGPSANSLAKFVEENHIKNVEFNGFYLKNDEWKFYQQTDMVNIYLMKIPIQSTPMANRFYKSLIFRKPMIVTKHSTQGEYVEKYDLGLAIEDCSELSDQIKKYLSNLDRDAFIQRCNNLLSEFVKDYDRFQEKLIKFLKDE